MSAPIEEPNGCCGRMIHNSFTGEYECADAYFALHDDGIDPYLVEPADLTAEQREAHAHWWASRRPDAPEVQETP